MVSKIAQIREEMSIAQDLTKSHILFVAVPVLSETDHARLKKEQAAIVLEIARAVGVPREEQGK